MANETDIDVLREMVRIAENRRNEELEGTEKMNRYNLALIAFAGTFLSLIVTAKLHPVILIMSGFFLSSSIICSLLAIYPRKLIGGVLAVDEDIAALQRGETLYIHAYMIDTARLTDNAAQKAGELVGIKKRWTIFAALFLASSVVCTYIISVCLVLRTL